MYIQLTDALRETGVHAKGSVSECCSQPESCSAGKSHRKETDNVQRQLGMRSHMAAQHAQGRFLSTTHVNTVKDTYVKRSIIDDLHRCPTASRCGPRSTPHRESGGPRGCQYEHGDTGDLTPIQLGRPVKERIGGLKGE